MYCLLFNHQLIFIQTICYSSFNYHHYPFHHNISRSQDSSRSLHMWTALDISTLALGEAHDGSVILIHSFCRGKVRAIGQVKHSISHSRYDGYSQPPSHTKATSSQPPSRALTDDTRRSARPISSSAHAETMLARRQGRSCCCPP